MDEASSRFVDRIVLEKLLKEKLSKVRHDPSLGELETCPPPRPFGALGPVTFSRDERSNAFLLQSPAQHKYAENEWFRLSVHEVEAARGALIFIHGLFEDNREIYRFLIGELNRLRYSVYVTTLPYHYERVPKKSLFSGEFFLSANLERTVDAFQAAAVELDLCQRWLRERMQRPVFVVGFSMGATVALLLAAKQRQIDGTFVINPAAGLARSIWTSPLCQTIRDDLLSVGLDELRVTQYLEPICPLSVGLKEPAVSRIKMVRALYDLVTQQSQYDGLAKLLPPQNVLEYRAGHLNTLRVPRLATDIVNFFDTLPSPDISSNCTG